MQCAAYCHTHITFHFSDLQRGRWRQQRNQLGCVNLPAECSSITRGNSLDIFKHGALASEHVFAMVFAYEGIDEFLKPCSNGTSGSSCHDT